jgi:uncharacterized membrane protein YozB (DUF420 family)
LKVIPPTYLADNQGVRRAFKTSHEVAPRSPWRHGVVLSPLKIISIFVCVLIGIGVLVRKNKRVHIPLMIAAFLIDLSMVLYIEITRDAIASAKAKMGPLMIVHLFLSVTALALYIVQFITGILNAMGKHSRWHSKVPYVFVTTRLGNLLTSFLIV